MKELAHCALKYYMHGFPVSKGKGRILSALWKPLSFGKYRRSTTLGLSNVRMSCDLTKFLQRELYFYSRYEDELCRYWMEVGGDCRVIFDVGANVGLYSLLAAANKPNAVVHAFEPSPEMVRALKDNIRLNGFRNVLVNSVAVGRSCGKGFLHVRTGRGQDNEGMSFVTKEQSHNTDISVEQVSLDDYCQRKQIARIDLLKMDIEGGEFDALLGAQGLLQRQAIGYIFVELTEWAANRSGHSTVEIKRMLMDAGYRIYKLKTGEVTAVEAEGVHNGDNVIATVLHLEQLSRGETKVACDA